MSLLDRWDKVSERTRKNLETTIPGTAHPLLIAAEQQLDTLNSRFEAQQTRRRQNTLVFPELQAQSINLRFQSGRKRAMTGREQAEADERDKRLERSRRLRDEMVLAESARERDVVAIDGDGNQLNLLAMSDSELSAAPESEPKIESPTKSLASSEDDDSEGAESPEPEEPRRSRRERRRIAKAAELSQSRRDERVEVRQGRRRHRGEKGS